MEKAFLQYKAQLDTEQVIVSRLNFFSRELCSYSKKIIFQAHRFPFAKTETEKSTIQQYVHQLIHDARILIQKQAILIYDPIIYNTYFQRWSFGLEEYCEAILFWHWLTKHELASFAQIEKEIIEFDDISSNVLIYPVKLPIIAYIGGICDLSGEIMRVVVGSSSITIEQVLTNLKFFIQLKYQLLYLQVKSKSSSITKLVEGKMKTLEYCISRMESLGSSLSIRGDEGLQRIVHHSIPEKGIE